MIIIQMPATETFPGNDSLKPIFYDVFTQIGLNVANNSLGSGQQASNLIYIPVLKP